MRAVEVAGPGGPDVMSVGDVPRPAAQEGEVVIRVVAAGVNRADILQRQGLYPAPRGATGILGLEVAGIIEEAGRGVGAFSAGDRVVALTNGGGYAEFVSVPAGQVLPLPQTCSFEEGAALPETLFTVQQTLIDRAGLKEGETVLVHAGASGIGGAAIQLARLRGAIPFCTVSTEEKARYALGLGAEAAIVHLKDDFEVRIKELTGKRGVDKVLDIVGGDFAERNLRVLARHGTLIILALMGGGDAEINFSHVLVKNLTIFGSTLRSQPPEVKAAIATHLKEQVWPHINAGRYRFPRIRVFALGEVVEAHRAMERHTHFGKIVLQVDPDLKP
ncbi:MAG: NAD(P)H-quinone oxidoreductase [Hyphomicrobiaceae bacterium]|nr:NAD(P)H-quinone oxidoreductase [Hyphomicrobiaceae bacterium]